MSPSLISFLLLLVFSGIAAILVDRLLRPSLREMLDNLVEMPAATTFYVRAFTATIFLAVLARVFGGNFNLKAESRFIEYVWELASNLEDSLQNIFVVLLIFAAIFVILLASLRRKR